MKSIWVIVKRILPYFLICWNNKVMKKSPLQYIKIIFLSKVILLWISLFAYPRLSRFFCSPYMDSFVHLPQGFEFSIYLISIGNSLKTFAPLNHTDFFSKFLQKFPYFVYHSCFVVVCNKLSLIRHKWLHQVIFPWRNKIVFFSSFLTTSFFDTYWNLSWQAAFDTRWVWLYQTE